MGFNLAALSHLQRQLKERQVAAGGAGGLITPEEAAAKAVLPLKRKAAQRA